MKHPKIYNTLQIINYLLCALPLFVVVLWLPLFPDTIPAHFTNGQVDRLGSKYELLLFVLTNAIILAIVLTVVYFAKKKNSTSLNKQLYSAQITSMVAYLTLDIMYICLIVKIYNLVEPITVNTSQIILLCLSLVLIVVGIAMLFVKSNKLLGIRTKQTLSNPEVWHKVNFIGGIILIVVSLALLVYNLVSKFSQVNFVVTVVTIMLYAVVALVLSALIPKTLKKQPLDNTENIDTYL